MSWSLRQETNRGIGNGINYIITIIILLYLIRMQECPGRGKFVGGGVMERQNACAHGWRQSIKRNTCSSMRLRLIAVHRLQGG